MQMSISGKQPDAARLLVVDDEIRLLRSLQELLVLHGYQTELAQGGRQAIERLDNDHFDAILLDLRMEDISGHDVLQHIADQQYETPVIVISGESSFGAITQALLLGATDYIRKPYSSDELLKTLSNTLTNQRLKTENRLFQQRLWQSEKLHRHLVEHSPDVIYVLDHEGRFTFINNRVSDLLGYQTEALLGQHFSVVLDDEEEWQQLSCDTGHGDVESSFRKQAEIRVRNKFHQVRHLYVEYFPLDFSQTGVIDQSISEITSTTQGTFGIARDITERKQAEQTIQFQAYHDLLTGLPNRTLFKDRLEMAVAHAKRNKDIFAVLFIDLDRFKVVNDSLGHATGDLLLQAVSETLRSSLREGDTLARFGGDEFTLLLPSLHSEQDAATIAGKIMARLASPFLLDGHEIFIGASIGIALYPRDGTSMNQLVGHADLAMYQVKKRNRNGFCFYESSMDAAASERLLLENDIRRGIEGQQFCVQYQPQMDIDSGKILGMEALVRWRHPLRGLLLPNEFIPIAEESGLVLMLGEWVLRQGCAALREWLDAGLEPIRMGINFSVLQIEQPDFTSLVLAVLEEHRLDPSLLEVEITENLLMKDWEGVVAKLQALHQHGVKIALDDFGTGFSSLSYLQKFPLTTLKIDRVFINEINVTNPDACLVDAIASIGKGLKLNLVAEGVETAEQLDYLRRLGCHEAQGFLLSRSLDPSDARSLLERNQNRATVALS